MPPEGVPLKLKIAGVGVRVAAQIIDILITSIAAICVVVLLVALGQTGPNSLVAIASLLFLVIRIPYYAMSELAWNGQTLGKRLMDIKVVAHDGGPLTVHALVLRNLMKEAEVFLPATLVLTLDKATPVPSFMALGWVILGLMIPLFDRHRRRLGDMMAGTHVIHLPIPILLPDLAGTPLSASVKQQQFVFLSHQLDHYGAFELQTLENLLRVQDRLTSPAQALKQKETVAAIIEKIRMKIGYADPVPPAEHVVFLRAFYNAQREHLEKRQLFGDRRRDKHYASGEGAQDE